MTKATSLLPLLNFSLVESASGEVEALAKAALIFVEGKHKDSMGREHLFDPQRIQKFVQNTNKHLEMGGRLPVQMVSYPQFPARGRKQALFFSSSEPDFVVSYPQFPARGRKPQAEAQALHQQQGQLPSIPRKGTETKEVTMF